MVPVETGIEEVRNPYHGQRFKVTRFADVTQNTNVHVRVLPLRRPVDGLVRPSVHLMHVAASSVN